MATLKHNGEAKHPDILRRERRQAAAEKLLDDALEYWANVLKGEYSDATHGDRIRAAENIANRFGLPIRTDVGLPLRLKVKTVELRGFVDPHGKLVTPEDPTVEHVNGHTNGSG